LPGFPEPGPRVGGIMSSRNWRSDLALEPETQLNGNEQSSLLIARYKTQNSHKKTRHYSIATSGCCEVIVSFNYGWWPTSRWFPNAHTTTVSSIGVARGGHTPQFLEYLVILCFERWYPKENTVASIKSKLLTPSKFWADYATGLKVRVWHTKDEHAWTTSAWKSEKAPHPVWAKVLCALHAECLSTVSEASLRSSVRSEIYPQPRIISLIKKITFRQSTRQCTQLATVSPKESLPFCCLYVKMAPATFHRGANRTKPSVLKVDRISCALILIVCLEKVGLILRYCSCGLPVQALQVWIFILNLLFFCKLFRQHGLVCGSNCVRMVRAKSCLIQRNVTV